MDRSLSSAAHQLVLLVVALAGKPAPVAHLLVAFFKRDDELCAQWVVAHDQLRMHCFSPSTWARERQRTLEAPGGAQDTATTKVQGRFTRVLKIKFINKDKDGLGPNGCKS